MKSEPLAEGGDCLRDRLQSFFRLVECFFSLLNFCSLLHDQFPGHFESGLHFCQFRFLGLHTLLSCCKSRLSLGQQLLLGLQSRLLLLQGLKSNCVCLLHLSIVRHSLNDFRRLCCQRRSASERGSSVLSPSPQMFEPRSASSSRSVQKLSPSFEALSQPSSYYPSSVVQWRVPVEETCKQPPLQQPVALSSDVPVSEPRVVSASRQRRSHPATSSPVAEQTSTRHRKQKELSMHLLPASSREPVSESDRQFDF